jgi:predicted RNase H-like HicB family nuclease
MREVQTGRRASDNPVVLRPPAQWLEHEGGVYRCMAYLIPQQAGGFSAEAATLPGVVCQGNTEQEALAIMSESIRSAILSYRGLGKKIPWLSSPPEPKPGSKIRWVIVHA